MPVLMKPSTVLEITRGHKDAWLFANPVNEVVCPGYFSIVKVMSPQGGHTRQLRN